MKVLFQLIYKCIWLNLNTTNKTLHQRVNEGKKTRYFLPLSSAVFEIIKIERKNPEEEGENPPKRRFKRKGCQSNKYTLFENGIIFANPGLPSITFSWKFILPVRLSQKRKFRSNIYIFVSKGWDFLTIKKKDIINDVIELQMEGRG